MSVRRAGSRRSAPASASTRSRSSRSRRGPVRQSTTLWRLCASTRPILDQPDARGRARRRQWTASMRGERSAGFRASLPLDTGDGPVLSGRDARPRPRGAHAPPPARALRDARRRVRPRGSGLRPALGVALPPLPRRERAARTPSARDRRRRGGVVVCVEPNPLNPAWYAYITLDRLRSWRVERGLLTIVPWALVRDYRRAGLSGVTRVMYGAVPIPAVNRWPGLLALEARLNRIPGLRLLCAVQIVRGVRDA